MSAASRGVGADANSLRKFISNCVSRETSPGSPERPRRLGAVGGSGALSTAVDSTGRVGRSSEDARDEAELVSTGVRAGRGWDPRREGCWSRPPRFPRRCRSCSLWDRSERRSDGVGTITGSSAEEGTSVCSAATVSAGASTGVGSAGLLRGGGSGISAGSVAPSRVALSCAFVFQSARRKRSAAVKYHLPASAGLPLVSKYLASSNATMASRVFEKRLVSCPAGSLPVRARRMRAVICFQSAIP